MTRKINMAIIGLGFGAEFIPIYQQHPFARMYAICQRNEAKLNAIGDAFGIDRRYSSYDELLKDSNVEAVHINTPIPEHGPQSIKALKAGKHVACTVPMATSIDDCRKIVALAKSTGKTYMMMETVVYSREYLFMKELLDTGRLGKLQFVQASHQQDMDGWPNYWPGLPPMWYATHCVGPVGGLIGKASMSMAARPRWNGRLSSTNRLSCIRRNGQRQKFRRRFRHLIMRNACLRTFGRLPPGASTILPRKPI